MSTVSKFCFSLVLRHTVAFVLPCGRVSPGSVFVSQNVDYLLDELCCCHMVAVLGCTDQVVTHFLLISLLCGVLSTVRLERREKEHILHSVSEGIMSIYISNTSKNVSRD